MLQLSKETLSKVLRDVETQADEALLFLILQKWAKGPALHGDHMELAKGLVQHLDLAQMPPKFLATEVTSSRLVPESAINVAFRKQALDLAERAEGSVFKRARCDVAASLRESDVLDYLRPGRDDTFPRYEGTTLTEICGHFPEVPASKLRAILNNLVDNGEVFTTIDDDHFSVI